MSLEAIRRLAPRYAALFMAWLSASTASAQQLDEKMWYPDGGVRAIVQIGNSVYVGGGFNNVRCRSGSAAPVHRTTAEPAECMTVTGTVHVIVPDGNGGWYLGGQFTDVQGVPRASLARLASDYTVTPWNPGVQGEVYEIAVSGSTVYVGGNFTFIAGVGRSWIAALDASTGAATDWNPSPDDQVRAIVASGSVVYVGGFFNSIGGQPRNYLAALDASTGLATAWDPNLGPTGSPPTHVRDMLVDGATVYIAGIFQNAGGQLRTNLAALDAASGAATAFAPNANAYVQTLLKVGSTLYAGGNFTSIGGAARMHLAAVDAASGLATSWNPSPHEGGYVYALSEQGGTIFAGGGFVTMGGVDHQFVAALDPVTGVAAAWSPLPDGPVETIVAGATSVFAGGNFSSIGVKPRKNLAAFDATTGYPTDWNPGTDFTVNAMVAVGTTLYLGGEFQTVAGASRSYLAAVDATTGTASPWSPNPNARVNSFATDGTLLYVGGSFGNIGGVSRRGLASFALSNGLPTPFNPVTSAVSNVQSLELVGPTLYLGGMFYTVDQEPRQFLAAVDALSGDVTSFNPPYVMNGVYDFEAVGPTLYLAGTFGSPQPRVAALDAATGSLHSWDPGVSSQHPSGAVVVALARHGTSLYLGGRFDHVGGIARSGIAAVDRTTGAVLPWYPGPFNTVSALLASPSVLYVGGSFNAVGDSPRYFAAFSLPDLTAVPGRASPTPAAALFVKPNPTRGPVDIEYRLPRAANVEISVFDLQGREVSRVAQGSRGIGAHRVQWDGRDANGGLLPAGVYTVLCRAGDESSATRLVLVH